MFKANCYFNSKIKFYKRPNTPLESCVNEYPLCAFYNKKAYMRRSFSISKRETY